eukprot:gnl/MRDRNA2_/MRDRNA2_213726_c0_seq1.p1 gnl/MRDRNA2_/MRDRNA2_213726_c0~~gnl/MRDRNA2_/MRDRNA2_213726_c0_seq1.p1  ORF type:complete len:249 (-),score=49.30 gnl/MRDRNA2_/MRDRNA2_213726_c0_seq1:109-747(-)
MLSITAAVGLAMSLDETNLRRPLGRLTKIFRKRRLPLAPVDTEVPPEGATCRICHEAAGTESESGSVHKLEKFCNCRGSVAFVHRSCLEKWRDCQIEDVCELCGFEYSTAMRGSKATAASTGADWKERPWKSYTVTVLLVWLWLCMTGACEEVSGWDDLLTHCTLEKSVSGWMRSSFGSILIGVIVCGVHSMFKRLGRGVRRIGEGHRPHTD